MTQTKMTQKQAMIKATSLLKGLDNSVAIIAKKQAEITKSTKELAQTLISISTPPPVKPVKAKAEKPAKPAKAEKPAKVKPVKAEKPAKAEKPVKAEKPSKVKPAKAEKPANSKAPALKPVMIQTLGDESMSVADLYNEVKKIHDWSRQSIYNALKDVNSFAKDGDKFKVAVRISRSNGIHDDEETDRLLDSVAKSKETMSVI